MADTDVRLQRLALKNFKGVEDFDLAADGADITVRGRNGAGKTTLYDGWLWLLTGKDSLGQATFDLKTLGPDGQPKHNLDHEVEATLRIVDRERQDVRDITLRRVYREVWTKRRGSATSELSGHTTDFFVNGVPCQQAEYVSEVRRYLGDEQSIQLVSSPTYFNEQMKWQDRREILMGLVGQIPDEEIIASHPELAELPAILAGHTVEEHRRIAVARRRAVNDDLKTLPARIDEASRALPDLSSLPDDVDAEIEAAADELRVLRENRAQVASGGGVAELKAELAHVSADLEARKNDLERERSAARSALAAKVTEASDRVRSLRSRLSDLQEQHRQKNIDVARAEARLAQLRDALATIKGRTLETHPDDGVCPTCGQTLPADQVAEAHAKAEADFNRRKAEDAERNIADGKAQKAHLEEMKAAILQIGNEMATLQAQVEEADAARIAAEEAVRSLPDVDPMRDATYFALVQKSGEIGRLIFEARAGTSDATTAIDAEIERAEARHQAAVEARSLVSRHAETSRRITELEAQEKVLAADLERLERELYLLDLFTRARVARIEGDLNAHFGLVRVRLFEELVNGGLQDVCEVTVGGVPYSSLNHGHRIAAGLDVCRTLARHYGLQMPVFVDNRESLTVPVTADAQVISLVVSDSPTLEVEVPERAREAV